MVGLLDAISTAKDGITIAHQRLGYVSNNLANLQTPGFTRKQITNATLTDGQGNINGVSLANVTRVVSDSLQSDVWAKNASVGYTSVKSSYMDSLSAAVGSSKDDAGTFIYAYGQFVNAYSELAANPNSADKVAQVTARADDLVSSVHDLNNFITHSREAAQSDISDAVDEVNGLLTTIKDLNVQIGNTAPADKGDLEDQRDNAITQLSQYVDIRVTQDAQGRASVTTQSGISLVDHEERFLYYDPSTNNIYSTGSPATPIQTSFRDGKIKGLYDYYNTLTDPVNGVQANLLFNVIVGISSNTTLARGLTGGNPVFGIAGSLTGLSIDTQIGNWGRASGTLDTTANATYAPNGIPTQIVQDLNNQYNITIQPFVKDILQKTSQARDDKDYAQVSYDESNKKMTDYSSVNIDEEMSNMLQYQQAYAGSARVMDVATKMFDELLKLSG